MRNVIAATILAIGVIGCQGDEQCTSWSSLPSWSQCGDKQERRISCEPSVPTQPGAPIKSFKCTCLVAGVIGKSFEMAETTSLASDKRLRL